MKMKIAIVGCGGIAQVHAKCISRLEDATLVAAADIKKDRADKMVQEYGGAAYTDLETMLDAERPDILHICTPHYLHTPMAVLALHKGCHVFCEKPPVISFEQWDALRVAVNETKQHVQLGLCLQNRYNTSVQYVKGELQKGTWGKVLGARGIVNWFRTESYYTESDWRGKLATEGGGALINQSVHTLDLIQYLIDEQPELIEAVMDTQHLKEIIEVEDTMSAYIRYPSAVANFYVSTSYQDNVPPLIEVSCERATVRIEENRVFFFYRDGRFEMKEFEAPQLLGKSYWGASHESCIRDFYDCIRHHQVFSLNTDTLTPTICLMLKAYESARSKMK